MTDHSDSNARDDGRTISDAEVTGSTPTEVSPRPSSSRSAGGQDSASALVQPGSDLGTRYHIESALGEGGMGSVYKAYDRALDRRVAIKVIRAGLVADPDAVRRFKQELLLGSKVSHRNILRIHDLGEVGGLSFISMAWVDGEDLHNILRREGRLPIPRAVRIARQVAEALEAAHAEGVVHRDLKPHNILIDKTDTAFVSDFGLAKSLSSGNSGVTRSGELLGTPRYMAPEQVEGGPIDHRVDLYALGLMLYEMVTGTVPFHGNSAIQELLQRVRVAAPDPASINAELPRPLADLILHCLERDPSARFQTAGEIVAALDAQGGAASGVRSRSSQASAATWTPVPAAPSAPTRRFSPLQLALAGAAAMALVAAAVFGTRSLLHRAGPAAAPSSAPTGTTGAVAPPVSGSRFVAVLPFRVLGSQEQLGYVGDGVVEALSSRLFQVESLHVVSSRDVEQANAKGSIQAAARALGAGLIVEGTVQGAGDQLRFVVNLHDIDKKRQIWSNQFSGPQSDLFRLQDEIFDGIVKALGVAPPGPEAASAAARPTDDIGAYDLYLKGRAALRTGQVPQIRTAIDLFEEAIRKDQGFALAHSGLADASLEMYKDKKDSFWSERAKGAALRARDLDESLPEVHFSLGSVYLNTGKVQEAVVVLKRALELAPNSDEAHRRLGMAYRALSRRNDAIEELRKAVEVNPYFWLNYNRLGGAYLHFGEHDKALEAFRRVTELEPESATGFQNMGSVLYAQGRWEECIRAYEQALKFESHWMTFANVGSAYFYLKRYPEAVRAFEKATQLNPNDTISFGNLADALRWSGERDRAAQTYARAIALGNKELQVNPRDEMMLTAMALYHAKSGNGARATEYLARARAIDPRGASQQYVEAVIDTLSGREVAALASLERALAAGYSAREAAADPELAPLAKSPAFDRLIKRYLTAGAS